MSDCFLYCQDSSPSFCLGMALHLKTEDEIEFSHVYAVEFIGRGLIHDFVWKGGFLLGKCSEVEISIVHMRLMKLDAYGLLLMPYYLFCFFALADE